MRSVILKTTLVFVFIQILSCQFCNIFIEEAGKTKVFLTKTSKFLNWFTISGDSQTVSISLNLLTTDTKTSLEAGGIWSGIGFGGWEMQGTDMVICYNNKKTFGCWDAIGQRESAMLDYEATNGVDNTKFTSGSIVENLTTDYGSYKSLVTWNFNINIGTKDANDWSDWANWQTNKGKIIGAVGYIDSSTGYPNEHTETTDGKNILLVNMNNNPLSCSGCFIKNSLIYLLAILIMFLI